MSHRLSPSMQTTLRIFTPDGKTQHYGSNHLASAFQRTSDATSGSIPNHLSLQHTLLNDRLRHQVKLIYKSTELEFTFDALTPVYDNTVSLGQHSIRHQWVPMAQVKGQFNQQPLQGTAMLCHQYQSAQPQTLAVRWHFYSLQDPVSKNAVVLLQFLVAKGKSTEGDRYTQAIYTEQGQVKGYHRAWSTGSSAQDACAYIEQETKLDNETGYAVCYKADYQWTFGDKRLTVHSDRKEWQARISILGELPFLLRKFLQTFIAKPYVYMFLQPHQLEENFNGMAYQETTFILDQ